MEMNNLKTLSTDKRDFKGTVYLSQEHKLFGIYLGIEGMDIIYMTCWDGEMRSGRENIFRAPPEFFHTILKGGKEID